MSTSLLNVLDVSRALGPKPKLATRESVALWLTTEYFKKKGGAFNYDPAIAATYQMFRGESSLAQALEYCGKSGSPKGYVQNQQVVRCISEFVFSNISTCYRAGNSAHPVGRIGDITAYIGIKAALIRVMHDRAFIVLPGYRMSHRPSEDQLRVVCSIAHAQLARDDLSAAEIEYLYAGPAPDKTRSFRVIHSSDLEMYSRYEVDQFIDVFVKGLALAADQGVAIREPSFRNYSVIDPNQMAMF